MKKNSGVAPTRSKSKEDLSEYADAEESITAPTELLAEFLYSVMVKDYEKALQYCTEILSYEPDYATVKEFRPLIEEKLKMLRNEKLEGSSSDSSLSCSSSTSSSSDNLHNMKNVTCWEAESSNCSSLESDEERDDILGIRSSGISQADITNGNAEIYCSFPTAEDSIKINNSKEINTSATRTIIHTKLPPYQTQTRVLRRESPENGQNNEFGNLKNENPSTLLHPTNTRVLSKRNSLSPIKDNSRTFAWISSLQKSIFGGRRQENARSGSLAKSPIIKEKKSL